MNGDNMYDAFCEVNQMQYYVNVPQEVRRDIDRRISIAEKSYFTAIEAIKNCIKEHHDLESLYDRYREYWDYSVDSKIRKVLDNDNIRNAIDDADADRWRQKQAMFQEATRDKLNHTYDAIASWLRKHASAFADVTLDDCPHYDAEGLADAFLKAFPKLDN